MGRRAFIDQQPASRIGSGTPTGVCARSGHHRKKRQPIIHPGLLDRERIIASQPELLPGLWEESDKPGRRIVRRGGDKVIAFLKKNNSTLKNCTTSVPFYLIFELAGDKEK
jgi:hypothetical protein